MQAMVYINLTTTDCFAEICTTRDVVPSTRSLLESTNTSSNFAVGKAFLLSRKPGVIASHLDFVTAWGVILLSTF